jgi:hypothetical protein
MPLIAIFDKIGIMDKTKDGPPLFKLILNKSLPIEELISEYKTNSITDEDGKSLLHYAI